MNYQKLFNHMADEHGVILTETEMIEICNIVREAECQHEFIPHDSAWKKCVYCGQVKPNLDIKP